MNHRPIIVIHGPGAAAGGATWRDALARADWPGPVVAPDLPGHGTAPAPVGGAYETGDALLSIVPLVDALPEGYLAPVIVGVGANGWAAHVFALGAPAASLVVVDGLGGPWRTPAEQIAAGRDWLRSIAHDPAAVAPPPASGLDPRAAHGVVSHSSRRLALKAAVAMPVPVLVVETPASPLSPAEAGEIAAAYQAGGSVVRLPDESPDRVVEALAAWLAGDRDGVPA